MGKNVGVFSFKSEQRLEVLDEMPYWKNIYLSLMVTRIVNGNQI